MPERSLKDKTVGGVGWTAVDTIARYGISFVVSIVLARILSPDEYGLIGILTIFINVFNVIVDGGFTNAIIRKQNAKDVDYCTVFYTNLAISVFMTAVLFFCAGHIAAFFERPELVSLTRAMSLIVIINALAIVPKARLTKFLDFKSQTKITVISASISGVLGIGMAIAGCGVWALVGQQLTCQLLITILLWIFNKWLPQLLFSWKSFKELWDFGWKLLVSGILGSVWDELYQVVIGKCYSPATLGLYTRALQFASLCSSNLTAVVQRVSFPVLSTIQGDVPRLKEAYKRIICTTMLPTFVLMFGMAASAKQIILVLIGEQWLPCVPYLQIICFIMVLNPLHALNLNAIQVMGRSDLTLKLKIIKTLLTTIPLILGVFFNIYYMLVGSVITGVISYYLNTYYSKPLLNYGILEQIKDVLPSFGVAMAMAVPVYAMAYIPLNQYVLLPLQILVGTLITIGLCEKVHLGEYIELKGIAVHYFTKFRSRA